MQKFSQYGEENNKRFASYTKFQPVPDEKRHAIHSLLLDSQTATRKKHQKMIKKQSISSNDIE
jgi:hypothetical protein